MPLERHTISLDAPSWVVDFLEGVSVWDLILVLAGVVALIVFIRKKGWTAILALARGLINAAQILESVQGLPAFQTEVLRRHGELEQKVGEIHHEVHFNNGSSVKDATSRIEEGVAGLYREVDSVKAEVGTVQDSLARLAASDEEQWNAIERTAGTTGADSKEQDQ